jgi:hypothetical protein
VRFFRLWPVLLALPACASTPQLPIAPIAPAARPLFDPIAFFTGRTEGRGRLSKVLSGTEATLVEGRGTIRGGSLHLVQQVEEGDKPAHSREWVIRENRPGHYSGTLSDAEGPVSGEAVGNRLQLAFVMKGGLRTEQWLTLSPDGQRAYNVLKVRKFGITVAVLSEDIRRLPR